MNPPAAEGLAHRLFIGPALRTQPDGRLVKLVREGYEAAFEEIVRRYGRPLGRYAAAIVGGRAEDVTQDAFSKALLAMRRDDREIELRPWLYRIVRNTALNDLRDSPPASSELEQSVRAGSSAAEEAERREEMAELVVRLKALPEPQRAAIVMRELEGLSHDEIAAALGLSGGAARQAIYRARLALRDGLGLLIPLPLVRTLIEHGTEASVAGAGGATLGAGAVAAGGAGAGATGALKVGLATVLIAGSVGAGVALDEHGPGRGPHETPPVAAQAARAPADGSGGRGSSESSGGEPSTGSGKSGGGADGSSSGQSGASVGEGRREPAGQSRSGKGSGAQPTAVHQGSDGHVFGHGAGGGRGPSEGPAPGTQAGGGQSGGGPGPGGGGSGGGGPGPGENGGGSGPGPSGGGGGGDDLGTGGPLPGSAPPPEQSSEGPGGTPGGSTDTSESGHSGSSGPGSGSGSGSSGPGSGSVDGSDGGGSGGGGSGEAYSFSPDGT